MERTVVAALGGGEWAVIIAAVVLVFGAAKLPQLARSIGASAKEFRKGLDEGAEEKDDS